MAAAGRDLKRKKIPGWEEPKNYKNQWQLKQRRRTVPGAPKKNENFLVAWGSVTTVVHVRECRTCSLLALKHTTPF
jgi:hypothetical protein